MATPNQPHCGNEHKMRCLKQDVISLIAAIAIFIVVIILALASTLDSFKAPPLPSFKEPTKGFEPRGTDLSDRINTAEQMENPDNKFLTEVKPKSNQNMSNKTRRRRSSPSQCQSNYYSRLVFESKSSQNLLTANNLKSMCELEKKIMKSAPSRYWQYYDGGCPTCCSSISLGNIIAQFVKKKCETINDNDVKMALDVLKMCSVYFVSGKLNEYCDCGPDNRTVFCPNVPCMCSRGGIAYKTLNYLTDSGFLGTQNRTHLKYAAILSPIYYSSYDLFKYIYETHLAESFPDNQDVKVVGFSFADFRFDLFNILLVENAKYPGIAMVLVLIIMCFFLKSFLLAFAAILTIIFALIMSYFLYMVVFGIKFFPFLNVVTLVFIVGIGADDAFVYYDIFRQIKRDFPNADVVTLTLKTLRYAALSMFVTSFTTSAAFFANLTSHIISIKLFGIYAGLSILTNYLLMVTWFPLVVMLHERWVRKRPIYPTIQEESVSNGEVEMVNEPKYEEIDREGTRPMRKVDPKPESLACKICWAIDFPCHFITRGSGAFSDLNTRLFDKWLPNAILKKKLYFLWIFLFVGLTIGFACISFVSPGLQLPTFKDFQVFSSSSTIEQYNLHLKEKFRYSSQNRGGLEVKLIWGVKAQDNGNYLDPDDKGSFVYDDTFSSELTPEAQKWLSSTCQSLLKQSFFTNSDEFVAGSVCGIERLQSICFQTKDTCCKNITSVPFSKEALDSCAFWRKPRIYYDKTTGAIRAISMYFYSNVMWTAEYDKMDKFWNQIVTWADKQFSTAPPTLKNGWVVSTSLRDMYSLQYSLQKGTISSMGVSLGIAFGVMLLTTLNIFISVYAIITIVGVLSMTVGCLVLIGWQLSVLESIVLSVSVGLSIDFTMHYGVAYRLAPQKNDREARVHYSLVHIGPAILMAAFTTFTTGLLMMPAIVLVYIQLGQFLMLVMTFSWLFATFAFLSLSAFIGPVGNFGQLSITRWCRKLGFCKVQPRRESVPLSNQAESEQKIVDSKENPVAQEGDRTVNTTC